MYGVQHIAASKRFFKVKIDTLIVLLTYAQNGLLCLPLNPVQICNIVQTLINMSAGN